MSTAQVAFCVAKRGEVWYTLLVVNFLKRREGLGVYDYETRFNPLLVTE